MPQIRVLLGFQQGQVFPLQDQPMAIGRDPKSAIVLHPDSPASRRHAEIFPQNGHWRVRDLGSVNGTELNGRRIQNETLRDKDEVIIGDNVFVFEEATLDAAEIEQAVTRMNGGDPAGFQNRPETHALVRSARGRAEQIVAELCLRGVGTVENAWCLLTSLVAGGAVLLDGARAGAGVSAIRSLGTMAGLQFERVDLHREALPEVLAAPVHAAAPETVATLEGPIFSQLLLVDGIQRAPLETRKLVFDAIATGAVHQGGLTRALEMPWCLVATQSRAERGAAYPLTEAQLRNFMCSIPWPDGALEAPARVAQRLFSAREILALRRAATGLPLSDYLTRMVAGLVRATRPGDPAAPEMVRQHVHAGAGARASEHLTRAAKARAVLEGRLLVLPSDVHAVAASVLRHRIFTNFTAAVEGITPDKLIAQLLASLDSGSGE